MTVSQMVVGSEAIYTNIVKKGLALNLNGADTASYPGTGTTWFDTSGNGRNATLVNNPVFENANTSAGLGSFKFDGVSQYANVTGDMQSVFFSGCTFTVEMWIKNTNTAGCPLSTISNFGANNFSLMELGFVGPTYTARYFFRSSIAPGSYFGLLGGVNPPANSWNQYVVTFIPNTTKAYQGPNPTNGQGFPIVGPINTTNPQSWSGPVFPQIARSATTTSGMTGAGSFFAGNIGILRIYNRVLQPTEIQQNYQATRAYYGL